MLKRCEDTNLALNWEKSHFMVKEGIVLGHKISKKGIEVDKAKIDVIAKLPHPTTVKGIRSFLRHADFKEEIKWKKPNLPDLTPTCMTLELADRLIIKPIGIAEDVFLEVGVFHFPADFVVVDFDADPRVPLILKRSFLKTGRALIDVYEGELVLRDGNEQITFHVNGTPKHPQNHVNELIKMVNDTCKDSFKRFTDEPTPVSSTL
ncbi:reverse transcriptase domain-containing protein [Tanacetum coccineum]